MTSIKIEQVNVSEKVIVLRKTGTGLNEGNITCIEMDDGLIFIDTGRTAKEAKDFRKEMEKRFNKKTKLLLLTHYHVDHFYGVEAFKDVPIFATQKEKEEYLKHTRDGYLTKEDREKYIKNMLENAKKENSELPDNMLNDWIPNFLNAKLFPITFGIKDEMTIGYNNRKIIFKEVGGHTVGSAYIQVMPENILITGDNLNCEFAENSGCMLGGMNWEGIKILELFEELNPTKVIPGHGSVVYNDYITASKKYFSEVFTKLKVLKEDNIPLEEAIKNSSLPEFFEKEKHAQFDLILSSWYKQL